VPGAPQSEGDRVGLATALGSSERAVAGQVSRLVAIRAIIDLAEDEEARDVAADELLVLGIKRQEIVAAMLDDPAG
jgi:hypothetical protein